MSSVPSTTIPAMPPVSRMPAMMITRLHVVLPTASHRVAPKRPFSLPPTTISRVGQNRNYHDRAEQGQEPNEYELRTTLKPRHDSRSKQHPSRDDV